MLNKLSVGLVHYYLSGLIKELLHNDFDLVEEDGVERGALDLGPELLVGAHCTPAVGGGGRGTA